MENQKASSVLPHDMGKQIAPPSSEEPTSQKEASEDRDKDKRSKSSTEVIAMLQGMKATLLRLKKLEHDNLMHAAAKESPDEAELPTTSSAIDDEVEEEPTAEQKTLEDSVAPVKGRPVVAKTTKPRKRDSNRSSRQGGATSAALNDVMKSGLFMEKTDNEGDTVEEEEITADGAVEEEDPNFRQQSEVEQETTDLPWNNKLEKTLEDSAAAALKGRSNKKSSRKLDSNRSANTQLQTKRPSAAQQKMVKTWVNDLTKSGDDEPEGQQNVLDHAESANMKDHEQSPQVGEVQESGGIEDLEELMDPALGLENWNEVKRLVVETSGLLQELMKTNKGRRRHTTDTSKALYEFKEQQSDIDDEEVDDEFQSPPQETDERSAEENTTENSGTLHKGKNVVKRPPTTKHTKTVRHGPNRLALQHAGAEKKPMSSIKNDDDAREEDQNVLHEEKVNYDDNDGKEDPDSPQEVSSAIGDEAGEEESEPEHEQEMVNNDDEMGKEEGEQKHAGDESGEIRDQWQEKQLNLSREKQKTVMKSAKHMKLGKSDLNRSAAAQTQSHPAESMTQKMSYDPHAVLKDKPDLIDEEEAEQEMEEEYEKEDQGIMRSTNFESLLEVGDESKREMAVGKKRVSTQPQLHQPKATMSSVATLVGVGEFLECKNSESQVEKKKRAVAPTTKQRLSKPQRQAQLQGKANRVIVSSVKSVAFKDQKLLPEDDGGDDIGEVDEEAEEEESDTTEEVSHSTSV